MAGSPPADRTRALPVNDPRDRELTISCGAALFTLRLAARARGLAERTRILPDAGDPDLLAVVELDGGAASAPGDGALLAAVAARRTHRGGFRDAGPVRRPPLAARAGRLDAPAPPGRRPDGAAPRPGPDEARRAGHDPGPRTGAKDAALLMDAPAVAVLHTPGDAPAERLAAGQGLQAALLVAAAEGVQAGHLNRPCQVESLRPRLAELLSVRGAHPQVVVRLGRPDGDAPPAPRRPVADVLEPAAG